MSRKLELESVQAELGAVDSLLNRAIEVGDVIGEFQLKARKDDLQKQLSQLSHATDGRASVALFFGGKPVVGSRGIAADFAGSVISNFQELVTRSSATEEFGKLGGRGPVPNIAAAPLMVTGLARGSFGFVLDELADQSELTDTVTRQMVERVVNLIDKVSSTNEQDFEDIIETLDSRVLISLRDFFSKLHSAGATLRLKDDIADISLNQTAVTIGKARTEATKIEEVDEIIDGTLNGWMEKHPKFEFTTIKGDEYYGSVSKAAINQFNQLTAEGIQLLKKRCTLRVHRRTVTPLNRPVRFVDRLIEIIEPKSSAI